MSLFSWGGKKPFNSGMVFLSVATTSVVLRAVVCGHMITSLQRIPASHVPFVHPEEKVASREPLTSGSATSSPLQPHLCLVPIVGVHLFYPLIVVRGCFSFPRF